MGYKLFNVREKFCAVHLGILITKQYLRHTRCFTNICEGKKEGRNNLYNVYVIEGESSNSDSRGSISKKRNSQIKVNFLLNGNNSNSREFPY